MASLFRVMLLCFLGWCGAAGAVVPKQVLYWNNSAAKYPTPEAFCTSFDEYWSQYLTERTAAKVVYTHDTCTPPTTNPGSNGTVAGNNRTYNSAGALTSTTRFTSPFSSSIDCGPNSTASGSSCSCNSPFVEDAAKTACVPAVNECLQKLGQSDGLWKYDGGYGAQPSALASEVCKNANGAGLRCVVKVSKPECKQGRLQGVGSPYWYCKGEAFYTGGYGVGAACDRSVSAGGDGGTSPSLPEVTISPPPDELPPGTAAPSSCPPDTFEGTVNGAHTCVSDVGSPSAGQSPQSGQTTTKNPDGSTTTTTTNGSTTCAAGVCTTTNNTSTNITNNPASTCPEGTKPSGPNGSASSCTGTGTSTSSGAQTDFCKSNPKDPQCSGGSFGGDCAAGFQAKGDDPILNAMALEQYKRNCKFFENDTDAQSTVNKIRSGADTQNTTVMKEAAAGAPVTIQTFDAGGRGWGRACPADPVIPLGFVNRTFAIPFSRICAPLNAFAIAGVALTMLGAFVWVMGGKK